MNRVHAQITARRRQNLEPPVHRGPRWRQLAQKRDEGYVRFRATLWLPGAEEAAIRELAQHYEAQGSESPLGDATAFLITSGIDAILGHDQEDDSLARGPMPWGEGQPVLTLRDRTRYGRGLRRSEGVRSARSQETVRSGLMRLFAPW